MEPGQFRIGRVHQSSCRKEEKEIGLTVKPIDAGGIRLIEPIIHVGDERSRRERLADG